MGRKGWIGIAGLSAVLLLDQATKLAVRIQVPLGGEIEVIPGVLCIIHVRNPGAAWGFLGEFEHRFPLFIALSLLAMGLMAVYFRSLPADSRFGAAALAVLGGGALGNFVDRLRTREVTDFLDVHVGWDGALREFILARWQTAHWPTFNVADVAIVTGVAMFLVYVLLLEAKDERPTSDGVDDDDAETSGSRFQSDDPADHGDGSDLVDRPRSEATGEDRAVQPVPPGASGAEQTPGSNRVRADGGGLEPEPEPEPETEPEVRR